MTTIDNSKWNKTQPFEQLKDTERHFKAEIAKSYIRLVAKLNKKEGKSINCLIIS